MKNYKITNNLYQVIPLLVRDKTSTYGSRIVNLMPRGKTNSTLVITEEQMSPDVDVKANKRILSVTEI